MTVCVYRYIHTKTLQLSVICRKCQNCLVAAHIRGNEEGDGGSRAIAVSHCIVPVRATGAGV